MKGFWIILALAIAVFAAKWIFARSRAARDPIDGKALARVNFLNATGTGGYQRTGPEKDKD